MTEHEAIRIVPVTDPERKVIAADALKDAEQVHRQLRPALGEDYPARMAAVFRDGGEMCVALRDGRVQGVAVFRVFDYTHAGRRFYVDDLVTDEASRSTGVGAALLRYLEGEAPVEVAKASNWIRACSAPALTASISGRDSRLPAIRSRKS